MGSTVRSSFTFREAMLRIANKMCSGGKALFLLVGVFFAVSSAHAQPAPSVEYQVKASLIFNFLHFVDWPDTASGGEELTVCLFGRDRYGKALRILEGEVVNGKRLKIRESEEWSPSFSDMCSVIVFTELIEGRRVPLDVALAALANKPVLTIGEAPNFLEQGGMINFATDENTVQFEINVRKARQCQLTLSTKLLRLAKRVIGE